MGKKFRILTADLLIADKVIEAADRRAATIRGMVEARVPERGGKGRINKSEFEDFSGFLEGIPHCDHPGGSTSNTLRTLSLLLPEDVEGTFVGVIAEDFEGNMIKNALKRARIRVIPSELDRAKFSGLETAISFVMLYPDGARRIVTYPGNAAKFITPDTITEDMIRNCDALFLQGNAWEKFDRAVPDRLLNLRWEHKKELWLPLPTTAAFASNNMSHFQWLMASANVVMSNSAEVMKIFGVENFDEALRKLQDIFRMAEGEHLLERHTWNGNKQVGFITDEERGAMVVTADKITPIPVVQMPGKIVNTLGSGDTSYAGFLAGRIRGLNPEQSAHLAMALAAVKIRCPAPALADPRAALTESAPHIATGLFPEGIAAPGVYLG